MYTGLKIGSVAILAQVLLRRTTLATDSGYSSDGGYSDSDYSAYGGYVG